MVFYEKLIIAPRSVSPQTETRLQQCKMVCGDTDHGEVTTVKWSVETQTIGKRTPTMRGDDRVPT